MTRIVEAAGEGEGQDPKGYEHELPAKLPWEKMELSYRGNIAEMIQIGGGKLTRTGGDSGEARKSRGQESGLSSTYDTSDPLSSSLSNPLSTPFDDPSSKP